MAGKQKNSKYSAEIQVKAVAMFAILNSYAAVGKELGIPSSTIAGWVKRDCPEEKVQILNLEKKIEFAEKASDLINKNLDLLERRVMTALEHEGELAELLSEIASAPNEEISQQLKKTLISKIKTLEVQKMGDITGAIAMLYDKRALSKGEATENSNISIIMEGELEEWTK